MRAFVFFKVPMDLGFQYGKQRLATCLCFPGLLPSELGRRPGKVPSELGRANGMA